MPITPVPYHRSIIPATRTIVITVPKSGNGGITNSHQQPLRVIRKSEPQPSIVSGGIGGIKRVAIDSLICEQQQCSPRKRERLTHLSQEEKLNRRKLKNRVAAQTARDRKKLRTCKLEDALKRVSQQNAELAKENARLNAKLDEVIAENSRLQQQHNEIMRIHQLDADRKPTTDSSISCDASSWLNFGSAVGSIESMSTSTTTTTATDPPIVDSACLSDIDLQAIIDDLLQGTDEFDEFNSIEEDLLNTDEQFIESDCDEDNDQSRSNAYTDPTVEMAQTSTQLVVGCGDPMIDSGHQVPNSPQGTAVGLLSMLSPVEDQWLDADLLFCKQEPIVDDNNANDPILGCGGMFEEDTLADLFGYIN